MKVRELNHLLARFLNLALLDTVHGISQSAARGAFADAAAGKPAQPVRLWKQVAAGFDTAYE